MARIAYIRVSTEEQNTARQDAMMKDCDKVFTEKISGKNTDRPQLKKLMEYVREGDVVVVESYSRFSRNTADLLNLVQQLEKKGVQFISLHENVDTSTPQGKLIFTIFAGLAQFEREQTLQRQREGIEEAKAAGKYKGRQPIRVDETMFEAEVKIMREGKQTARQAMEHLGLKPNTFYRRLKELEKFESMSAR